MSKQISKPVFIFQAELDTKEVRIAELEADVERLEGELHIYKTEVERLKAELKVKDGAYDIGYTQGERHGREGRVNGPKYWEKLPEMDDVHNVFEKGY